jgi:1-acyl-sn-glycerol-3-phosphate acyltransferase
VFPFRRKRSWKRRLAATARNVPRNGRALRAAAAQLDVPWARSRPAALARESFMRFVLNPVLDYYARRRATGRDRLSGLRGPLILVANHASHLDTPVILSALPRRMRRRTVVAAAADYFYRNRVVAWLVSLIFNTTPIDRNGGGLSRNGSHLDRLLDQGWNLLLYPEGTRSRSGVPGRVRRGAAVLAAAHRLTIVPIRVSGTGEAMPPGRIWPRRLRGKPMPKRHRITVSFGEPITPCEDPAALIEAVQRFFENGDGGPYRSPYRSLRRGRGAEADQHA